MGLINDDRRWSAVCKRGHRISNYLQHPDQQGVPKFCKTCGAPVITRCESCSSPLMGGYAGVIGVSGPPDPFCYECGAPHRWATRDQRVSHLQNLLEFEDLDEATQLTVIEDLAVLSSPVDEASDDDRSRAAERVRHLAPNLWQTGLPVFQSVLTEAVKRKLGLA